MAWAGPCNDYTPLTMEHPNYFITPPTTRVAVYRCTFAPSTHAVNRKIVVRRVGANEFHGCRISTDFGKLFIK